MRGVPVKVEAIDIFLRDHLSQRGFPGLGDLCPNSTFSRHPVTHSEGLARFSVIPLIFQLDYR